jgi:uncharacterized protein (DUF2384 family)
MVAWFSAYGPSESYGEVPARRATGQLSAIIERLATVLDQEYVPVWLNRPLVALDHRKPIDVLASGGYEELSRIVAGLEAPTFS